ncbi:MAG: exonuclease SbcCD subunit D [Clostridia bacterium]|nr:exonuclease SbcCD subunit D [Clostridia bacterium]
MRFIHLGDLHIGKRVNDFLLLKDQEYVFEQIYDIIKNEKIEAVLIAGDVYDKQVPSLEAVTLFDKFLTKMSELMVKVYIISGNHDSPERLSFAGKLLEKSNVYVSHMYDGKVQKQVLEDEYGEINIYMLPFIKPIHVKKYYPDEEINDYNQAVKRVIKDIDIDIDNRNLIMSHQFVTGASICDSEELSIGGLENIDGSIFDDFDYVALGHIHGAQKVGRETLRYSGTPLKYSFSEINHKKSVTIVDVKEKGNIDIQLIELKPLHNMRKIEGTYKEITLKDNYISTDTTDYMHIVLKDEEDIVDAIGKLRSIYPNIMKLEYDNTRTRTSSQIDVDNKINEKTPLELFETLFELQNNQKMTDEQTEYMREIMDNMD